MQNFIKSFYKKYKQFEPVLCPYINEKVHFTRRGFDHLLWKSGRPRSGCVIRERLEVVHIAPEILSKSGTLQEYEDEGKEFLCFIAIVKEKKYKVVITKSGEGVYRFVSIIPNIKTGKRDNYL
jgi:hypothetical protein